MVASVVEAIVRPAADEIELQHRVPRWAEIQAGSDLLQGLTHLSGIEIHRIDAHLGGKGRPGHRSHEPPAELAHTLQVEPALALRINAGELQRHLDPCDGILAVGLHAEYRRLEIGN